MVKKVYSESIKKWALGLGISVGTLIGLYFMYLSMLGAITITGYSNDTICAGTLEDPCYAYINFTANEDIFIYQVGYDPYGRNSTFNFDPAVDSWILQRSWGTGWRTIPLNQSCTGTWCGLSNAADTRDFSVAFRKGQKYQIRIVAYKKRADDVIKWSALDGRVDPTWGAANIDNVTDQNLIDQVFPNLKINDAVNRNAVFQINNPLNKNVDISNLKLGFNEICGEIRSYQLYTLENRTFDRTEDIYSNQKICENVTDINGTQKVCYDSPVFNYTRTYQETKQDFYPTTIIKKGLNDYKFTADIAFGECANGEWGYQIDWIPEILIGTNKYSQKRWAWWNVTWAKSYDINVTESVGYSRTTSDETGKEPISIDISAINCSNENKTDARIIDLDGNEVPSYVASDKTIKFSINVTANYNAKIATLYCDATGIGAANYPNGLAIIDIRTGGINISLPLNNTILTVTNASWMAGKTDNGFIFNDERWRDNSYITGFESVFYNNAPQIANTACSISENSSVYIKMDCVSAKAVSHYEFWASQKMFHVWYENVTITTLIGFMKNIGISTTENKNLVYPIGDRIYSVVSSSPSSVTYAQPQGVYYKDSNKVGLMRIIKNSSIPSTALQSEVVYLRTNTEDPVGCYGDNQFTCNTPNFNLSWFDFNAQYWRGYNSVSQADINNSFMTHTNPVTVILGPEETQPIIGGPNVSARIEPTNPNTLTTSLAGYCNTSIGGNSSFFFNWWGNGTKIESGITINISCYQEFANESNICGGLSTGRYSEIGSWSVNPWQRIVDGDWATGSYSDSGTSYVFVNYTKPPTAQNAVLQYLIANAGNPVTNITFPTSCFNTFSDHIELTLATNLTHTDTTIYCTNDTSKYQIVVYDDSNDYLFEEAIWWNLSTDNSLVPTPGGTEINVDNLAGPFSIGNNYTFECQAFNLTFISEWKNSSMVNITQGDLCLYGGIGDWVVPREQNCSLGNTNVSGALNWSGNRGYAYCNGIINVTTIHDPGENTTLYINSTCDLKIKP